MRNRSGWAYGDRGEWNGDESPYLTILGSAYQAPKLYGTREEAEAALDAKGLREAKHMRMRVAHVTEIPHGGVTGPRGYAYRITGAIEHREDGPGADGLTWSELPAGQTFIGDAEILWLATGPATGQDYCKSRDGGVWAWSPNMRKWIPVAA